MDFRTDGVDVDVHVVPFTGADVGDVLFSAVQDGAHEANTPSRPHGGAPTSEETR